jgi:hypothetical protein
MKVMQHEGFTVDSHLEDEDDPYIFIKAGKGNLSFEGVRLYKIGDSIAYRVQKESKTHPYGKAYLLDVEGTFNDIIAETGSEAKAGEYLMKSLNKEFKKFFEKSEVAEKELRSVEEDPDNPGGGVLLRNASSDYATSINSRIA